MNDQGDDGARVGLWATLGIVTLLLFGLLAGLLMRQQHKVSPLTAAPAASPVAGVAMAPWVPEPPPLPQVPSTPAAVLPDAELDLPLSGAVAGLLYFDSASTVLTGNAAETLAAIRTVAAADPAKRLLIAGFHDASGDPQKNALLAKARATAVRDALVDAGVDRARLVLRKPEQLLGGADLTQARRVEVRSVD